MKNLAFQDVDGDGNKEILVDGSLNEGKSEWRTLSIFNADGDEITRQDCKENKLSWYDNPYGDRACPITGGPESNTPVSLDCSSLPCTIHGGWSENPDDSDTFHFVGGRYVSATDSKPKESRPPRHSPPKL